MFIKLPPGVDPSMVPIALNPDGSPPNFDDPPSLAPVIYALAIIMTILSFVFVSLRIYTNVKTQKSLAIDDYCCVIGWSLSTALGALVMTRSDTARHEWDIPLSFLDESCLKVTTAICMIYGPAIWCAKTAILTLYLRLFGPVKWMRRMSWSGIIFSFLAYGVSVPVYAVYMFPYGDEKWDMSLFSKFGHANATSVAVGAFSIILDIYILVLPLPIILTLKISMKKRIGLCAVFATGICAIVSSCLGLYFRVVLYEQRDMMWYASATYISVMIENFVAVIVSCVPAVVSSWKIVLKDSPLVSRFRSLVNASKVSLLRTTSKPLSQSKDHHSKPSTELQGTEDSFNLHSPRNAYAEVRAYQSTFKKANDGITKSIIIDQV